MHISHTSIFCVVPTTSRPNGNQWMETSHNEMIRDVGYLVPVRPQEDDSLNLLDDTFVLVRPCGRQELDRDLSIMSRSPHSNTGFQRRIPLGELHPPYE